MSYSTTVLADSPTAYWKLDETTGATQFADSSGNSHPATISGTPTYTTTYKVDVGSTQFNGTQYGSVASGAWFGSLTSFSVEAWFSTTAFTGRSFISYDNSGASPGTATRVFQFYESNGLVVFLPLMSSGSYVTLTSPTSTYNDGIWHHAVGTWDGTTARLYIDGSQVASAALSGTTTSGGGQPILIGTGSNNGVGNFNQYSGYLDEVAIYTTALNATQVSAHYTAGVAGLPSQARVEAIYTEALFSGTPASQVEANYIEAMASGTANSQVEVNYLETLASGTKNVQVETSYVEAMVQVQPAQVSSVYTESVLTTTPIQQVSSVYTESVLTTTPVIRAEGVYLEVLLVPLPVTPFKGWGMAI